MLLVGYGIGKPEEYSFGKTTGSYYSDVCLGGSGEGYPLVESLGSEYESDLGSPGGRVSGDFSEGLEVCAPGGITSGKYSGNIGGNSLEGMIGTDNGLIIWEGWVVGLVEVVSIDLGE